MSRMCLILTLALTGCATTHRDDQAIRDHDRAEKEAARKCEADPQCDVEGKRERAQKDFERKFPVTAEMTSVPYVQKYDREVCEGNYDTFPRWPKAKQAACNDKYQKTFIAKLTTAYPYADWNKARTWCDGNPTECRTWEKFEGYVREMHDVNLRNIQTQREEEQEAEIRRQQAAAIMQGFVYNPVTGPCVTSVWGNTVVTHCY